ncbi:family 43 glycosylhydrolase [Hymenobacter monticola]|uniref:Family 43 glycosylhydrolase n=1 Tax=Hymenobacter monticola TaxID=1705399 RepID=A0ABY4B0L2_9BACT|nr:family 43 glycosylhydrolase [Hymenobacter monticola]UOE32349.1 family 43 glycosylhydrolase [Hymenobacter monticola]
MFFLLSSALPALTPARGHRSWLRWVALLFLMVVLARPASALQGAQGVHDPSTIVKEGNKYWIFATGQGVYSMYSTDLVNWTAGPRPVFVNNNYPSWINTKVPGFQGNFWAPECIFMNGKYYLYYSCSTFGSKISAIGLATNVTLDPANPSYNWVDEGEVVSSNAGSSANAIDPAIFKDTNGDVWLSYGSFFGGLRVQQLNATTGKPLAGSTAVAVGAGNTEAAYLTKRGNFYYLFMNRGACCNGLNSTYYIVVGRSTSPTGPFLDQNGVNLNTNTGGSVVLNVSGRYVGPGHAGIFEEGGVSYFSHHYYDGDDNGAPKLGLAKLTWDAANWPVVSRDWVTPGRYEIASQNSSLVWQAQGCTGAAGEAITQGTRTGQPCQQWDVVSAGDGEYRIENAVSSMAAGVVGCSSANGAALELATSINNPCRLFRIDRANDGTLVFASANGNRVVEVPSASTAPGTRLALFNYNGCLCQRWRLTVNGVLGTAAAQPLRDVSIYPVPAVQGHFTVDLGAGKAAEATTVAVSNLTGQVVFRQVFGAQQARLSVEAGLKPGIYLVQVERGGRWHSQKLSVQ